MSEPRSVVITGASRGLGLASAIHLYRQGWRVVAAMRSLDAGLEAIRAASGAGPNDPRLVGVQLDLTDYPSVAAAAKAIEEAVGAPTALVHNAGIAAVGCVEELPLDVWEQMIATHVTGPAALTKALLPSMRAAGRGRIVVISSLGGVRGMPFAPAYSATKGAAERWAEALANEIAPFGLGVTVLVSGIFDTDIITDKTPIYGDYSGPYGRQLTVIERRGNSAFRFAHRPGYFADRLAKALEDRAPFVRRAVGADAGSLMVANRLLPSKMLHTGTRLAMGLPRRVSGGAAPMPMDLRTRLMVVAARVLPAPVLTKLTVVVTKLSRNRTNNS